MTAPAPPDAVPASRLQLPPGPWTTLLDGLCARFPRVSRAQWLDRFARGRVTDARGAVQRIRRDAFEAWLGQHENAAAENT